MDTTNRNNPFPLYLGNGLSGSIVENTSKLPPPAPVNPQESNSGSSSASSFIKGSMNRKIDPRSSSLSTKIVPPISSTSCLQMARPSPVPPYLRLMDGCSWEKDWKSRFSLLSAMPTPVSRTENSSRYSGEAGSGMFLTDKVTLPRSVNFSALPTRLTIIWRSLLGSVVTMSGTLVSAHQRKESFFSSAFE